MQLTKINETQRLEMVHFALEKGIVQAAQKYGTSSKTAAKWLKRFQNSGLAGLQDIERSSSPHPHSKITAAQLIDAIELKRFQPEIRAKEIIDKLNLNCSEGLLYRKLRAALNSGDSFYDKDLTRTLKEKTAINKEFTPFYLFSRKVNAGGETLFITSAINLHNGVIYLCYSSEQSALNFTVFADYLLFHLTTNRAQNAGLLFITGPKNNTPFLNRLFAKYQLNNPVFKERAAAYIQRHFPAMSIRLDNLLAEIREITQHEPIESRLLYLIADYNSNIAQEGKFKLLYPVQLSKFISDTEIIVEKSDYWQKANLLSSSLNNQIYILEKQKNHSAQQLQLEDTLNYIKKILLLKDSFNLDKNSTQDLLLKKINILKSNGRIDEACRVFDELIQLIDSNDRIDIMRTKIRSAQFHIVVDRVISAEQILKAISGEIEQLNDSTTSGYFYSTKASIKIKKNLFWQAILLFKRALRAYSLSSENLRIAVVYYELVKIFTLKGNFNVARQFGEQAKHFSGLTTDFKLKALIFCEIGNLYFHYNSLSIARDYYNKAMSLYNSNNYVSGIIHTYNLLGNISATNNDYDEALSIYTQVRELSRKYNDRLMYHTSLNNLGKIYTNLKDFKSAKSCLILYLNYVLHQSDLNMIARAYGNLAILYQKMNKYRSALIYFGKALKICIRAGFKHYEAAYLLSYAEILYYQQRFNQAQKYAIAALNKSLAASQNELIFQSRLIKIKVSLAIALQTYSQSNSIKADLRALNSLYTLYENSIPIREKIIAGFTLWEFIDAVNKNTDKKPLLQVIQSMTFVDFLNIQQLAESLLTMLKRLPDNQQNSPEFLIIKESLIK